MKKKWSALLLVLALAVSLVFPVSAASAPNKAALVLDHSSLALKTGNSAQLSAYLGGSNVTCGVIWTSDTPAVASVSRGTVKAVGPGTAMVTATTGDGRSVHCTVRVALMGIDVSSYQQDISWSDVKGAGVGFALIRAGYGDLASQADPNFAANYSGATGAGLKVGAYYLSYATTVDDAVKEANVCLSILGNRHLDYPVFYDIEPNDPGHEAQAALSSDQLCVIAGAFCQTIEKAGYRAGIYGSVDTWNTKLTCPALISVPFDRWIAHYDTSTPDCTNTYDVWQYSEKGSVSGITVNVDLDNSYRDYPNPAVSADISILSDTPASITLEKGKDYTFKFTPNGISGTPSFASGNSAVMRVVSQKKYGGCYYVKIHASGNGCTSLYSQLSGQKAVRRCVVTVH